MDLTSKVSLVKNLKDSSASEVTIKDASCGNVIGIGRGDFTTMKAYNQIDLEYTYANCLASGLPESGRIPIVVKNEKEAIIAAMQKL